MESKQFWLTVIVAVGLFLFVKKRETTFQKNNDANSNENETTHDTFLKKIMDDNISKNEQTDLLISKNIDEAYERKGYLEKLKK